MYQSKTDPSRKFGSAFRGQKFDSYHAGPEKFSEGVSKPSDQPEVSATPEEHGGDKVNPDIPEPKAVAQEHGAATDVHIEHNHNSGEHKVTSKHEDGHEHQSVYSSAAEAYEAGGDLANTDVKRREHPDQQGAQSEEDGFEMPDLA